MIFLLVLLLILMLAGALTGGPIAAGGIALAFTGLGCIITGSGFKVIPSEPLTCALVTVFGKPTKRGLGPGLHFLWPWERLILFSYAEEHGTLKVHVISDPKKEGAELEVEAAYRFDPNLKDLYDYLRVGGAQGVIARLIDTIQEVVREWVARHGWEEVVTLKRDITKDLYARVLGREQGDVTDQEIADARIQHQDAQGLGILLRHLSVTGVRPVGELAQVMASAARERRQREAEQLDNETRMQLAQDLVDAAEAKGEKLSLHDAFTLVTDWQTIREGKGTIFRIPGLERFGDTLARELAGILARRAA
ncbi:MAG: SPFH domain-containing protein [Candidatus Terrybacteria bacterium]|nr:SPFH domain-containing protein [Candidatus Terrybacteria bacterium]